LPEFISNTSPLPYLHQLEALPLLRKLTTVLMVPPAVVRELNVGAGRGVSVPDVSTLEWICLTAPFHEAPASLLVDLGPGESEVLALALERPGATAILDDRLARERAFEAGIPFTGTVGVFAERKTSWADPGSAAHVGTFDRTAFSTITTRTRPRVRRANEL
jgi:uncharacterized protein